MLNLNISSNTIDRVLIIRMKHCDFFIYDVKEKTIQNFLYN